MAEAKDLLVFDYNGTARSGKGTIVKFLCQSYPAIATSEETGKDYRAITKTLLETGQLHGGMSSADVTAVVNNCHLDQLIEIVSSRAAIIARYGEDGLYDELVGGLVAGTGRSTQARTAVKDGLRSRVAKIRDDGNFRAVLLDGRNLAPVVADLAGVQIRLRTFVTCTAAEAARRECLRRGIDPASTEAAKVLQSLEKRTREDAERSQDAARPDTDAIDYWQPGQLDGLSVAQFAAQSGRQILFDTTPFTTSRDSKAAMLSAAKVMFNDALNAA